MIAFASASACSKDAFVLEHHIVLTEKGGVPFPNGFTPSGSFVAENGELLIWSSSGAVLRYRSDAIRATGDQLFSAPGLIGARIAKDGRWIEYADTIVRAIVRVDSLGNRLGHLVAQIPERSRTAVYASGSWYVAAPHSDSIFRVTRHTPSKRPDDKHTEELVAERATPIALGRVGDRAAILSTSDPLAPIDLLGLSPATLRPASLGGLRDALEEDEFGLWRALQPVDVGRGYLQVFADLRSDKRVFVRYDESGTARSFSRLGAPMGFIGSVPTEQAVLAARVSSRSELVHYQYEWRMGPATPKLERSENEKD